MSNLHGPEDGKYTENAPLVFLAGPCRGAPQWQKQLAHMCQDLPIMFANPRRETLFAGDDMDSYLSQVDWEHEHLRLAAKSGTLVFWLACHEEEILGRSYAQTTRYELAEWLTRKELLGDVDIILGIESGFHGGKYIQNRVQNEHQDIEVVNSLEKIAAELRARYA